ncbi:pleckstrin homology domain-containing family D member 1-like isoform X3 [Lytechinus variegatus]|uniref:pleckstrin homology domain-containing family D member 1-like isoform X3 n=1 Tax=Lytechinus variegatus TaxID=7654 RepID=UPI001BB1B215|nr:pleckstrin homology domain-containing family D member 1-like isoform X3 [Lytechinus variegatus]
MCDIFGGDTLPSKVQRWGVLWKKPFSQNGSTKWAKRFFIIKEGFLLYYSENEKRDFERKRHFNMHPKGVIPLGGAIIEMVNDPTKMCAFRIVHDDLNGSIYLATDTEYDREKWVDIMRKSGRITWKNAELGESMIQTLEKQSLELARDSQRYREQLHLEALALRDEMDKNEELEKIAIELEEEKMKIENTARELLDEHERTKMELEETMNAMQQVASEKEQLSQASESYLEGIKALAQEREQKELELQRRESEMQQLSSVNKTLVSETNALKDNLKDIENKTNLLENELCVIEDRLKEKEVQAEILEEEKRSFNLQARELESSLHDLTVQKELTDAELKEEIIARRDAERRLKKAEDSLSRLESALKEEKSMERPEPRTERQSQLDVEIFTNVAHLKRFFEDIAAEAQLDSNKPIIMKNAIHARKSLVRKTKSFKFRKERDRNHARHRRQNSNPDIPSHVDRQLARTDATRKREIRREAVAMIRAQSTSDRCLRADAACEAMVSNGNSPSANGSVGVQHSVSSSCLTMSTQTRFPQAPDSRSNEYLGAEGATRSPISALDLSLLGTSV